MRNQSSRMCQSLHPRALKLPQSQFPVLHNGFGTRGREIPAALGQAVSLRSLKRLFVKHGPVLQFSKRQVISHSPKVLSKKILSQAFRVRMTCSLFEGAF